MGGRKKRVTMGEESERLKKKVKVKSITKEKYFVVLEK